jgi:hypothetical protein
VAANADDESVSPCTPASGFNPNLLGAILTATALSLEIGAGQSGAETGWI